MKTKGQMKKKRTYNVRLVKSRRTYTTREIAELFQVNVHTVRVWHRAGMRPTVESGRPLLFLGSEIRRFLTERRNQHKCRLKANEFFCPRCRVARASVSDKVHFEMTGRKMGKSHEQVLIKGVCGSCGCILTRFATENALKDPVWMRMVTQGQET